MNPAGTFSPAPAPGHQAPGTGNPVYAQPVGGEGNQSFNPVPPPLMAKSSASPAYHPASQQIPVTISSETVAGHFVSQPGQASPQQIPRTENTETEVSKPMVAVGSLDSVSVQQRCAPTMEVGPQLMNSQPGQIRQVASYASENAVNQSQIQPRYPVTGQMPVLIRAENIPARYALNPQQHSIAANLLSSQGGGPTTRLRTHALPPYSRTAVGVKRHSESLVAGHQQALTQGSISQGTPRGHRQQLVPVGNNSRVPAVPMQGPPMAALSQPRQAGPIPGVVSAGQGYNPQGVPQMDRRLVILNQEILRYQHKTLACLLSKLAYISNYTCAWEDPRCSEYIIFHHKAYTEGQYTDLGVLASLLVTEADNPNYRYVQWCGGLKTHIVANPGLMHLYSFDAW